MTVLQLIHVLVDLDLHADVIVGKGIGPLDSLDIGTDGFVILNPPARPS